MVTDEQTPDVRTVERIEGFTLTCSSFRRYKATITWKKPAKGIRCRTHS